MLFIYRILLFIRGEKVSRFRGLLSKCKTFQRNFCDNVFWKFGRAGNRESFSANEGEDVKQRNFFTANKNQYTVCLWGHALRPLAIAQAVEVGVVLPKL